MTEILKNINRLELMKVASLYVLFATMLVGIGGLYSAGSTVVTSDGISVDVNTYHTETIASAQEWPAPDVLDSFEFQEEENEDSHFSNGISSQLICRLSVSSDHFSISSFSAKKKFIKLFILFHSWKAFLQV